MPAFRSLPNTVEQAGDYRIGCQKQDFTLYNLVVVEGGGSEPDQHLVLMHLNSFRVVI